MCVSRVPLVFFLLCPVMLTAEEPTDIDIVLAGSVDSVAGLDWPRADRGFEADAWSQPGDKPVSVAIHLPGGRVIRSEAAGMVSASQNDTVVTKAQVYATAGYLPYRDVLDGLAGILNQNELVPDEAAQKAIADLEKGGPTTSYKTIEWTHEDGSTLSFTLQNDGQDAWQLSWSIEAAKPALLEAMAEASRGWCVAPERFYREEKAMARQVVFSPDGTLLAGGANGSPRLYVLGKNAKPRRLAIVDPDYIGTCFALSFSPDGKYLIASYERAGFVWRADTGTPVWSSPWEEGSVLSPDRETVFRVVRREGLSIRRLDEEEQLFISLAGIKVRGATCSRDGNQMAAISRQQPGALVVDARTGNQRRIAESRFRLEEVEFSADGRRLVGSGFMSRGFAVWDTTTGDLLSEIEVRGRGRVALDSDGSRIAASSWSSIYLESILLYDLEGELLAELGKTEDSPFSLAFSPSGKLLAAGMAHADRVLIWDLED